MSEDNGKTFEPRNGGHLKMAMQAVKHEPVLDHEGKMIKVGDHVLVGANKLHGEVLEILPNSEVVCALVEVYRVKGRQVLVQS